MVLPHQGKKIFKIKISISSFSKSGCETFLVSVMFLLEMGLKQESSVKILMTSKNFRFFFNLHALIFEAKCVKKGGTDSKLCHLKNCPILFMSNYNKFSKEFSDLTIFYPHALIFEAKWVKK